MFARIPFAPLSRWGRASLLSVLLGLPLGASCTSSEDTEPFVPAAEGARQPGDQGLLVSEADACEQLLKAAKAAYKRLGCDAPDFAECPGFLRPGGGSGCYEYYDDSVSACVKVYEEAPTCAELSPCFATAERNDQLPTCELVDSGAAGGAGGAGPVVMASGGAGGVANEGLAGQSGNAAVAGQGAGGAGG